MVRPRNDILEVGSPAPVRETVEMGGEVVRSNVRRDAMDGAGNEKTSEIVALSVVGVGERPGLGKKVIPEIVEGATNRRVDRTAMVGALIQRGRRSGEEVEGVGPGDTNRKETPRGLEDNALLF